MKVTILGMGGIGLGLAAVLSRSSMKPSLCLWAPTQDEVEAARGQQPFRSVGAIEAAFSADVQHDMGNAVRDARVIIIAVPGDGHKEVIDRLVPELTDHQAVVISSHMSLSALYLSQRLTERLLDCLVVAWATTAITASRSTPALVHVSSIRRQVLTSAIPSHRGEEAVQLCHELLGDVFVLGQDLLAATLANVNPINHLAIALCNLTRMDHGESWGVYYGISDAVGNLIEALDHERLELASAFGLILHSDREHLHRSFDLPLGTVAQMAKEQNKRRNGGPPGPKTLNHRYVTEDIPFGIVPAVAIGRIAGVDMPLHDAGLKIISALYGRDFAAENDILPELGIEGLSRLDLRSLARNGYAT